MSGLFKIIAVIYLSIIFITGFIGFFYSGTTTISSSSQIESPKTVVWRTLINPHKIPKWDTDIQHVKVEGRNLIRDGAIIFYYLNTPFAEVGLKEKVVYFNPEIKLSLLDILNKRSMLQNKFIKEFILKTLLDGSTEITLLTSYQSASFFVKIFDRIYLRRHIDYKSTKKLKYFKRLIENS